jgi:hypothetical protein
VITGDERVERLMSQGRIIITRGDSLQRFKRGAISPTHKRLYRRAACRFILTAEAMLNPSFNTLGAPSDLSDTTTLST